MTECLSPLAAPPLDNALQNFRLAAGFAPQLGEERIARRRPLLFLERVEVDADRDRDAFAANDTFAVAPRRDRLDEAARASGHPPLNEMLAAPLAAAIGR